MSLFQESVSTSIKQDEVLTHKIEKTIDPLDGLSVDEIKIVTTV